jgi:hypothetical protein
MKKGLLKMIWNWLKKKISIKIDFDIFIFVNNQWIEITKQELQQELDKAEIGIKLKSEIIGLKPKKKILIEKDLDIYHINNLIDKDVLKHI